FRRWPKRCDANSEDNRVVFNFDHELRWRTVKVNSNYVRNRFRANDAIHRFAFQKNFIAHLMHAILPSTNILLLAFLRQ
uniref:BolA-like protein 3 n=1 Tax=Parascaris univalens TaxID=6257 RepID=A0A915BSA7_PARUN